MSKKIIKQLLPFIVGMVMSIFIYCCTIREYGFSVLGLCLFLFSVGVLSCYIYFNEKFNRALDFIIKKRYIISLIVFIICVAFKVHGSSIGIYNDFLPSKIDNSSNYVLFGKEKGIRSDEYQIMTPYNFSQHYNNYKVESKLISLNGQNMIIGFNSAVKDVTVLGKPLVWGYILLGNEYGLSWYWCLKTILILLFSFEVLNILTQNKKISLLGALLITLGPSTQWWFAPHMPDVILWFSVLLTLIYYLVTSEKKWLKNVLTIIIPFVLLEYVVALFPSFQVGLGYFMVAIFLAIMYRDKNAFYKKKENIIRFIIIGILALGLVGYFLANNLDALKSLNGTIYPGSRMELGGNRLFKNLFTDLGTPFLGYTDKVLYGNQCEDSTYIHFGLFFLLLSPIIISVLKKKKDRNYVVGLTMIGILSIYAYFMLFGFPPLISKLTLFKYMNRMDIIWGYIAVIFTVWGISFIDKYRDLIDKKYYYLSIISFLLMNYSLISEPLKNFMPINFYYIEICIFGIILYSIYKKELKEIGYILLIGFLIFSSISINPINTGISPITNHPSTKFIQNKIKDDPNALWAGYNNFSYSSYLISIGAKTANAMNFYPDYKKWSIIDPNNEFENEWNRYTYLLFNITKEENNIFNVQPDTTLMFLDNETVEKLGIKYILVTSEIDLDFFNDSNYKYEKIYEDKGVRIYEQKNLKKQNGNLNQTKKMKNR